MNPQLQNFKSYQEVIDKILERLNAESEEFNKHFFWHKPSIEDVLELTRDRLEICINGLLVLAALNRDKENADKIPD